MSAGCALALGCASAPESVAPAGSAADGAASVRFVHGAPPHGTPGPWALAGHRIGVDALRRLGVTRGDAWGITVTHRAPAEVRYTCVIDGVQAATGASLGKLNLALEPVASPDDLETVVVERRTGRTLTYRLTPAFRARFFDADYDAFPQAARELDRLPDDEVFVVVEALGPTSRPVPGAE